MNPLIKILLLFSLISTVFAQGDAKPDMRKLSEIARIMHSEVPNFPVDKGWEKTNKVMQNVDIFDDAAYRMMSTFCSYETNKSVLIVGEPSDTFKYIWSRFAMMQPFEGCQRLSHVDIKMQKLQGFTYVGTTERNWRDFIENPAYNKDVVVYMNNLALLIGIGTSMNRPVGIEATYVAGIQSGALKTVAFVNKYDYNRLVRSRHGYVIDAFQEVIQIEEVTRAMVDQLVRKYLEVNASHLSLSEKVASYMYRNIEYFQPNQNEPQRTMGILLNIIRNNGSKFEYLPSEVEIAKPYTNNMNKTWFIEEDDASTYQILFEYFQTEANRDYLTIYDAETNVELAKYSSRMTNLLTKPFEAKKLKLVFTSDGSRTYDGFKIKHVKVAKKGTYDITLENVRQAIFETVQIPQWIFDRDYSIVRELPAKLDADVVGVIEGKKALINQVKIGYVSGRTDEKPAGSLLLVGPTGTGKSYIARKAAEFMDMKLITVDMTQYASEESFDRFLDTVSNYLVLYPYAIYLFEEIDKANFRVLDRLYFMMDEGIFYDKSQRPLFARGAMIMMTTNAGHDLIIRERNNPELRKLVNQELQKHYRPSFLNRFDSIPIFLPFTEAQFGQLANIMITKKIQKMKEYWDWDVTIDPAIYDFCAKYGQSELYGARPMERLIDRVIAIGLSEFQIEERVINFGEKIAITKIPNKKFEFKVAVGRASVTFKVDVENNSGDSILDPKFIKFFNETRMY